MNKKIVIIASICVFILLNLTIAIIVLSSKKITATPIPLETPTTDGHGCATSNGYEWCEVKQKCIKLDEETCEIDQASELLTKIKNTLKGIPFSGIIQREFLWNTLDSNQPSTPSASMLKISGKGIDAVEIPSMQLKIIDKFFNDNGFDQDIINTEINEATTSAGYIKDNLACLSIYRKTNNLETDIETTSSAEAQKLDIKLSCGLISKIASSSAIPKLEP